MGLALGLLSAATTWAAPDNKPMRTKTETRTFAYAQCGPTGGQVVTIRHIWMPRAHHGPSRDVQFTLGQEDIAVIRHNAPLRVNIGQPMPALLREFAGCVPTPDNDCKVTAPMTKRSIDSIHFTLKSGELRLGQKISGEFRLREHGRPAGKAVVARFSDVPVVPSGDPGPCN